MTFWLLSGEKSPLDKFAADLLYHETGILAWPTTKTGNVSREEMNLKVKALFKCSEEEARILLDYLTTCHLKTA